MDVTLAAVTRDGRGKNEARRLRRSGRLPAVLYGGESTGGVSLVVDPDELHRILHSESGVNTLIALSVDGGVSSQVMVRQFQLDPISNTLLHVDFYRPALDKVITVTVPVLLVGEPVGVKQQGGLVDFVQRDVQVECLPTEIPEHIEVDVTDLMIGQGVRLRDTLQGVAWKPVSDPDTLLVHVVAPKVEAEPEEAVAEAEAAAVDEDADAEGAKKGKAEAGD
jgi:large subunit ribosomal protein L25